MAGTIFISYRRADSEGFAHAIYNLLAPEFGAAHLFMDVDAIRPGQDFVAVLEHAVDRSDILIALIGPKWLEITGEDGRRRLDNPQDFVRIEIATALKRGITVIPVLVGGAAMPGEPNLPDDLKPLARRQAFLIGQHLTPDVQRLVRSLREALREAQPAGTATPARAGREPGRMLNWGTWFVTFLVAALSLFAGVILLFRDFLTRLMPPENSSLMEIMLLTTLVGLVQWLILLRPRYANAGAWILANLAFGILGGIAVNGLIQSIGDVVTLLFFTVWAILTGMLGPAFCRALFREKT